ncbi:unnamed protein product [Didymodactylos carnosus]|uniref:Uncharacterized protein n=1 Tax=Didymodactylos carnosus TaxID=1234261 RepID=A0A815W3R0_9BILA|nr:unnamed protein product [Didymodactylos carnosus]CAF4400279.1 unnamed protein product [Didymodactylos carnosus]
MIPYTHYQFPFEKILIRPDFRLLSYLDMSLPLQKTFCGAHSLSDIDLVSSNIQLLDVCNFDQLPSLKRLSLMDNPLYCSCSMFYLKYGDIYRLLLNKVYDDDNQIDTNLEQWLKPELRRHIDMAYIRGDLRRPPIEFSLFSRCAQPTEWKGLELVNITHVSKLCHQEWEAIENSCQTYCDQHDRTITTSNKLTTINPVIINRSTSFAVNFHVTIVILTSFILYCI